MEPETRKEGADYLAQFQQSPYKFRANKRVQVEGKSTLKGSWQTSDPKKGRAKNKAKK